MSGWTNKGKYRTLQDRFQGAAGPAQYNLALVTSATTPTADTDTKGQLTEVANGNGYSTGGQAVNLNSTDFDTITEDDANDRALVQLKDYTWTGTGGTIPISGGAPRWAILTDNNATQGSREVLHFWDLGSDRNVSDGQTLTLQNLEIRIGEAA